MVDFDGTRWVAVVEYFKVQKMIVEKRKRFHRRLRHRRKDNTKIDLKEIGCNVYVGFTFLKYTVKTVVKLGKNIYYEMWPTALLTMQISSSQKTLRLMEFVVKSKS
jgi:hypothetical protein